MSSLDGTEIWRSIPPEEKLDLMSQAHAKGILAAFITLLLGGTIAVGLHLSWILWGSLVSSPLVFQFAAGKAWRGLRPKLVLEYLAARSAARRYAFSNKGKDLTVTMMFRGRLEQQFEEEKGQEALEAVLANNKEAAVWIALFGDSVVMMSEHPGGAKVELAQVLNDRLEVESRGGSGESDYSNGREVLLTLRDKRLDAERHYKVTSNHAAALVVFEKKLKSQIEALKKAAALIAVPQIEALPAETGGRDSGNDDMQIPVFDEY